MDGIMHCNMDDKKLKFIKLDIENGLKYLKLGLESIINSLLTSDLREYTLCNSIKEGTLVNLLQEFYPNAEYVYKRDRLYMLLNDNVISICFKPSCIEFKYN